MSRPVTVLLNSDHSASVGQHGSDGVYMISLRSFRCATCLSWLTHLHFFSRLGAAIAPTANRAQAKLVSSISSSK